MYANNTNVIVRRRRRRINLIIYFYLAHATVLWPLLLLVVVVDDVLLPSAPLPAMDNRAAVLPLWFSISGSTTISCSSYDSGGVVVVILSPDRCVVTGSVENPRSTTTTVDAFCFGAAAAVAGGSRGRVALGGGLAAMAAGPATDRVANVFAAMAAGGGTAVTIGPPSTTAEAMALVACVVAMAVAEVDAVIGMTGTVDVGVRAEVAVFAVAVFPVTRAVAGPTVRDDVYEGSDGAVVATAVVVAAAVTVTCTSPCVFVVVFGEGALSALLEGTVATECFLDIRGDDLTAGCGRLAAAAGLVAPVLLAPVIGLAATVGLAATAGLAATVGLAATAGPTAAGGCDRLGVLGDLSGNGDLGCSFRGVGGPDWPGFLRGDDLVDGTSGGLPAVAVFDRSFVDTDNRCLVAGERLRPVAIRGSDDCRLSGSDDGLDARDRPFSGVLNP